jgi:hypothetical protein
VTDFQDTLNLKSILHTSEFPTTGNGASRAEVVQRLHYGLENLGINSRQGQQIYFISRMSKLALGPTKPPIQWIWNIISLEVRHLECETDPSSTSTAEVKKERCYTFIPHHNFMVSTGTTSSLYYNQWYTHKFMISE